MQPNEHPRRRKKEKSNFGDEGWSPIIQERNRDIPHVDFGVGRRTHSNVNRENNVFSGIRYANSRGRGNENRQGGWRYKLDFDKLVEFIAKDPEEIIIELSNPKSGLHELLLSPDKSPDLIVLLLSTIAKVCTSKFISNKAHLLLVFSEPVFVDDLKTYIINLPLQDTKEKERSKYFWKGPDKFFENLIYVSEAYIATIKSKAFEILPKIIKIINYTLQSFEENHHITLTADIKDGFKTIQTKLLEIESEIVVKKTKQYNNDDNQEPPDNFRYMSIYPSTKEITTHESTFLRKNIVVGKYNNVEHYLDVQFRLLREDFVAPLREGICNYLKSETNESTNMRLYHKVRFVATEITRDQVGVVVQLPMGKETINYENSKRFIYGSLVLCTADNFKTIYFGKVVDSNINHLQIGQVIIGFQLYDTPTFDKEYIMIESTAYFEPYYHVLIALKRMNPQKFPLQKYLIDVEACNETPKYLENIILPRFNMDDVYKAVLRNKSIIEGHKTNPEQQYLGLNKSQSIAFREALTNKLSIIQGPPGTGKTHLALKVVKTLLVNRFIWETGPMLIICYTNHALDQFLEGLLDTCDDMVRVGSKCKNEKLAEYNLREQRNVFREDFKNNPWIGSEIKSLMRETESALIDWTSVFNASVDGALVVAFENLTHASMFTGTWFCTASRDELINWLLGGNSESEMGRDARTYKFEITQHTEEAALYREIYRIVEETTNTMGRIEIYSPLISLDQLDENINALSLNINALQPDTIEHYIACEQRQQLIEDKAYFADRLNEIKNINIVEMPNVDLQNPHTIPASVRWNLYAYWLRRYKRWVKFNMLEFDRKYRRVSRRYEELKCIEDTQLMRTKAIIGMTTTAAARLQTSLQSLKCPIVIVEEAAEVLESHIISALTSECQHLILIGDHQQLRPSTANFRIEREYKLGISLFERMIKNNIQCNVLTVQHRMRPEIARLIVPAIYETLDNHPSVYEYPKITGIDKPLYFIHHTKREFSSPDNSKENDHEAQYLILLARHLILNGYKSEDITILAAYSGQLFNLMKRQKNTPILHKVRICVLDNFQGEECKIILLSLVRNNQEGKIGFLSIENRVCVALSRAKHGLYIMGNMDMLCGNTQKNNPWPKIKPVLKSMDALGGALQVRCERHPDQINLLRTIKDFEKVPEGGCLQECGELLKCGHTCTRLCHIGGHKPPVVISNLEKLMGSFEFTNEYDDEYNEYDYEYTNAFPDQKEVESENDIQKCYQSCIRISLLCKADHICPLKCYEKCEPCVVPKQTQLKCGHIMDIPCSMSPTMVRCSTKVLTKLPCDHEAEKPCYINNINYECREKCEKPMVNCNDPDNVEHRCMLLCRDQCKPCSIPVQKTRTVCPHIFKVACSDDVNKIDCTKPCKKILPCNHKCMKKCFEDCGECNVKVLKLLSTCGHMVTTNCSDEAKVENCGGKCPKLLPCGHMCLKKCKQACTTNCGEMVDNPYNTSCGHTFKIPCNLTEGGEIINLNKLMLYCREKCTKILECGHACSGSCSECAQGRMHKNCQEKCGITLVCDHACKSSCGSICQPCTEPCTYICTHGKYKQTCGKPCSPCKEACSRNCEHVRCSMKCFQKCDVKPCNFPCTKKIAKCGHDCIGFCGDICPPKCKICDASDVLFLETDGEQDARFIYLVECGHIVASRELDEWIQQDVVMFKKCPKCNTNLSSTARCSDYIKSAYEDINAVNRKFYGDGIQNDQERKKLKQKVAKIALNSRPLTKLSPITNKVLLQFMESLKIVKNVRKSFWNELIKTYISKIEIYEQILNTYLSVKIENKVLNKLAVDNIEFLFAFMLEQEKTISNQTINDYLLELNRLNRIMQFIQIADASNTLDTEMYNECYESIFIAKPYEENIDIEVIEKLKKFNNEAKTEYVITEREQREIVRAISLSKGHWFKCSNGHIYVSGESEGASQITTCIECKDEIQETRHALLQAESLATEM